MMTLVRTLDNYAADMDRCTSIATTLMTRFPGLGVHQYAVFINWRFSLDNAMNFIMVLRRSSQTMVADFTLFARYLALKYDVSVEQLNHIFHPFVFRLNNAGGVRFDSFDAEAEIESPFFRTNNYRNIRSGAIRLAMLEQRLRSDPIALTPVATEIPNAPARRINPTQLDDTMRPRRLVFATLEFEDNQGLFSPLTGTDTREE